MKKANVGLMVASEVAKTKGGQEAISGSTQTANRIQSVIGWTITALILAGGGYLIWRLAIKPALDKAESSNEQRADVKEGELVLKEYEKLGLRVDPTKNYKGIADAIQNALSAWAGVDGSRPVQGTFTSTNYTLVGALIDLFNPFERNVVNQIFATKNMKTRI